MTYILAGKRIVPVSVPLFVRCFGLGNDTSEHILPVLTLSLMSKPELARPPYSHVPSAILADTHIPAALPYELRYYT